MECLEERERGKENAHLKVRRDRKKRNKRERERERKRRDRKRGGEPKIYPLFPHEKKKKKGKRHDR